MQKSQNFYALVFIAALSLMPLLAVAMPRFMAFGPPLIGLLAFAAWPFMSGGRLPVARNLFYWLAGLCAMAAAGYFWALDPGGVLSRLSRTAPLLLGGALLAGVAQALPAGAVRQHLWMVTAFLAAGLFLMCAEMQFGHPVYKFVRGLPADMRVGTSETNRGVVTLLACAVPLFAATALRGEMRRCFGFFILCGIVLSLTASQSAQLAFFTAVAAFLFFPYKCKWSWMALYALLAGAVLAAPFLSIWMFDNLAARIDRMPFIGDGFGFGAQRMEIWDFISRHALQRPFTGFGIEAARAVPAFDTQQVYGEGATVLHPHNVILQFWIEFGAMGALWLCGFFGWLLASFYRLGPARARIALPSFIMLLTVGSLSYGMWQGWWLGLLFLTGAIVLLAMKGLDVDNPPYETKS